MFEVGGWTKALDVTRSFCRETSILAHLRIQVTGEDVKNSPDTHTQRWCVLELPLRRTTLVESSKAAE